MVTADSQAKMMHMHRDISALLEEIKTRSPLPPEELTQVAEALKVSLEELRVADGELHQQNDELIAENEELIEARPALEADWQHYETLFRLAPIAYLITDALGIIQEANAEAAALLNRSTDLLKGKPLVNFVAEKDRRAFRLRLLELTHNPLIQAWDIALVPRKGEAREAVITVVHGEDRSPRLQWLIRDVTAIKRAEEILKKANEELERRVAERTADLREAVEKLRQSNDDLEKFAYISSHDLQEPLRMIGSYVGLLAANYKDKLDDDAKTFIGYAEEGAVRMSSLVRALLGYFRINTEGREFVPTDAQAVVRQVLANLEFAIKQTDAQVVVGDLPTVLADAAQLGQVFQNLIDNAIKFRKDNQPPVIQIAAEANNDQWLFTVRDNGIGIDPRFHEHVFVAFKRLHANRERYPGTGIGLAIVKRIIDRHHGSICVNSKEGEGSTFYFALPMKPGEP